MGKRLIYAEDLKQLRDDYIRGKIKITFVDEYDMVDHCPTADPFTHGKWEYWDGWVGNHDQRIDDATCSECGYKHPTVRWEKGDKPKSTPDKLFNFCPQCGAKMDKE